jgi:hypothetical protein
MRKELNRRKFFGTTIGGLAALTAFDSDSRETIRLDKPKDTILNVDCGSFNEEMAYNHFELAHGLNDHVEGNNSQAKFTFFITAGYLFTDCDCGNLIPISEESAEKMRNFVHNLAQSDHEVASHGLSRNNGKNWSEERWYQDIRQAEEIFFHEFDVDAVGFRAPFLGWNDNMYKALASDGYEYDVSRADDWSVQVKHGVLSVGIPRFTRTDGKKILAMDYNLHVAGVSDLELDKMLYRELKKDRPLNISLSLKDYDTPGKPYHDVVSNFFEEVASQGALEFHTMREYLEDNYGHMIGTREIENNSKYEKPRVIIGG